MGFTGVYRAVAGVDRTVVGLDREVIGVDRAVPLFSGFDRAVSRVKSKWLGYTGQWGDWWEGLRTEWLILG